MISQVLRHKTKEWVIINPFCTTQSPTKTKEWVIINPFCTTQSPTKTKEWVIINPFCTTQTNIEFEQMILKVFIFCICVTHHELPVIYKCPL